MAHFSQLQVQPHVLLSLVLYKLVNPVQARGLYRPLMHICDMLKPAFQSSERQCGEGS